MELELFDYRILYSLFLVFAGIFITRRLVRDRRLDSIPGPQGYYPFIGIGSRLPPRAAKVFRKWALEYGDIFKIRVGWYNWVVINSPDAVHEILEKQSMRTSSKAPSPMGHDVVTGGHRMPSMPYGTQWRVLRKAVRELTNIPMTATLVPSQEFEAKQLLFELGMNNEDQRSFYQHMRRYAFSIILTNSFGNRVRNMDHPAVQNSIKTQQILRRMLRPGAFLVDEFPLLAKLPKWLQPGRKEAENAAKEIMDMKRELWEQLQKQIALGKAPYCYAREIYYRKEYWHSQGLTEDHLIWLTTGLVEAGFETTAAILNSLVLHLAANKSIQDKAHQELMTVVGPARPPIFSDIQNLPYIRSCVKEMLRMNPILVPGIQHYADKDVIYKDIIIPKGTVLIANTAFLHYDSSRFEDPFEFMPERYMSHHLYSSEYAAMGDPMKRDHFTFSTGRRACPGARLAENSLHIALAGILWAYEIRPPLSGSAEVDMDVSDNAYADAGFTIPKPFAARFVPRTHERLKIVKEQWETAQKEGYELRGISVDVDGMISL